MTQSKTNELSPLQDDFLEKIGFSREEIFGKIEQHVIRTWSCEIPPHIFILNTSRVLTMVPLTFLTKEDLKEFWAFILQLFNEHLAIAVYCVLPSTITLSSLPEEEQKEQEQEKEKEKEKEEEFDGLVVAGISKGWYRVSLFRTDIGIVTERVDADPQGVLGGMFKEIFEKISIGMDN